MRVLFWLAVFGFIVAVVFIVRHLLRKHAERQRAAEARAAEFLLQMSGGTRPVAPAPVVPVPAVTTLVSSLGPQKLLFDAAHKAGEAGEHVLAIQLYGRLLARFPDTAFATQVRAAVEAQKKKLVKA